MKNLVRLGAVVLFAGVIGSTSSCKKDDCYECTAIATTAVTVDAFSICEGDDNGSGGTYTGAEVTLAVSVHEGLGGMCTKK